MPRGRLPRRLAHGEEATLVEHLGELRTRLLISLGSIAVFFPFTFAFHERLIEWLMRPLPDDKRLVTLGVVEPFTTSVKVAAFAALALALPVVLYQLWSFLAPAIEENAQRVVAIFAVAATFLFAAGVAFAYFVVLPKAISFLTGFDSGLYDIQIRASYYFSFVTLALFVMGIVFELPVFILALVRLQIVTTDQLRRNRRMAWFIGILVAVAMPTVDAVSLFFEVIPIILLFEISIWIATYMERRWEQADAEDGLTKSERLIATVRPVCSSDRRMPPLNRLTRLALLLVLAALVAPAAASAAPRMWMGFQDDPYFRWLPERFFMRDRAVHANSTIMKTTVYWFNTAPRRPSNAANPFDPAYRWEDLDEFVRQAEDRDIEVMLTIWGTPTWAGPAKNRLPRNLADIQNFARALASRYSGRNRGFPFVRFYSVWNEPNLALFLTPQFDAKGRSIAPANYARLYRAAYTGFKQGSPQALVAVGETSARGRDKKKAGVSDTHSPGKFVELLAKARPKLRFDAYAHHPYSSPANQPPTQLVRWPNVSMTTLTKFGTQLDKWFGRKNIPIWLTEYGHETRPEDPKGVTYAQQASYIRTAVTMARRNPRVGMLIWFAIRDNPVNAWQSGLMTQFGLEKPAFDTYSLLAKPLDARNAFVTVKGGVANPAVRIATTKLAYRSGAGSRVGITYKVFQRGRLLVVEQPVAAIGIDGWITIRPRFTPARGVTYTLEAEVGDVNGNKVQRTLTLVGVK